jgi:hypothetical protein
MTMANDVPTWRTRDYGFSPVLKNAQILAQVLEREGLTVTERRTDPTIKGVIGWGELVQAFADAGDAMVDEHVRNQREKAAYIDAHASESQAPEEAQETPHRISAQSIIVHFNDGSERIMHTHHPIIQQGGWKMRNINGVPFFILGHGIPRQMIPLCNVKSIDLSEELL